MRLDVIWRTRERGFDEYFGSRKHIKQFVIPKEKPLCLCDNGCNERRKIIARRFGC